MAITAEAILSSNQSISSDDEVDLFCSDVGKKDNIPPSLEESLSLSIACQQSFISYGDDDDDDDENDDTTTIGGYETPDEGSVVQHRGNDSVDEYKDISAISESEALEKIARLENDLKALRASIHLKTEKIGTKEEKEVKETTNTTENDQDDPCYGKTPKITNSSSSNSFSTLRCRLSRAMPAEDEEKQEPLDGFLETKQRRSNSSSRPRQRNIIKCGSASVAGDQLCVQKSLTGETYVRADGKKVRRVLVKKKKQEVSSSAAPSAKSFDYANRTRTRKKKSQPQPQQQCPPPQEEVANNKKAGRRIVRRKASTEKNDDFLTISERIKPTTTTNRPTGGSATVAGDMVVRQRRSRPRSQSAARGSKKEDQRPSIKESSRGQTMSIVSDIPQFQSSESCPPVVERKRAVSTSRGDGASLSSSSYLNKSNVSTRSRRIRRMQSNSRKSDVLGSMDHFLRDGEGSVVDSYEEDLNDTLGGSERRRISKVSKVPRRSKSDEGTIRHMVRSSRSNKRGEQQQEQPLSATYTELHHPADNSSNNNIRTVLRRPSNPDIGNVDTNNGSYSRTVLRRPSLETRSNSFKNNARSTSRTRRPLVRSSSCGALQLTQNGTTETFLYDISGGPSSSSQPTNDHVATPREEEQHKLSSSGHDTRVTGGNNSRRAALLRSNSYKTRRAISRKKHSSASSRDSTCDRTVASEASSRNSTRRENLLRSNNNARSLSRTRRRSTSSIRDNATLVHSSSCGALDKRRSLRRRRGDVLASSSEHSQDSTVSTSSTGSSSSLVNNNTSNSSLGSRRRRVQYIRSGGIGKGERDLDDVSRDGSRMSTSARSCDGCESSAGITVTTRPQQNGKDANEDDKKSSSSHARGQKYSKLMGTLTQLQPKEYDSLSSDDDVEEIIQVFSSRYLNDVMGN